MRDEPDSKGAKRRRLVLATWILIGGFDGVLIVLKGDECFFESFFRYLTYLSQWSLIGIGPAYVATVFYGIPVHFALKGLEIANLMTFVAAGALRVISFLGK